jgi:hypothetical protein
MAPPETAPASYCGHALGVKRRIAGPAQGCAGVSDFALVASEIPLT